MVDGVGVRLVQTGVAAGCSSLSLEDSVGLLLQVACDFTGVRVRLRALGSQILELELLFLLNFEQVDINGVVTKQQQSKESMVRNTVNQSMRYHQRMLSLLVCARCLLEAESGGIPF